MIRLIETASKHARVDRPPKGPRLTKGDVWFDSWSLRNAVHQFGRPKGAVVGIEESVITATSDFDAYATSWVRLPGGTLQLVDQFRFAGTTVDTYSVVDGTGVFANVRGTLHSSYLGPGERYLNVYRLRIP